MGPTRSLRLAVETFDLHNVDMEQACDDPQPMKYLVLCAPLNLAFCLHAQAAGGHHFVDDASMLEPGQSQLELWTEQAPRRDLEHLGPGWHFAGLEWGLNLDRAHAHDAPVLHSGGLQVKWAREWLPGWSAGAVAGVNWQSEAPHHAGQWLLLPVSWQAAPGLAVHLNVGRHFPRGMAAHSWRGIAVEWQPLQRWQGLVEWFHDGQGPLHRVGLRYLASDAVSIDLSRGAHAGAHGDPWWTLGLNLSWGS